MGPTGLWWVSFAYSKRLEALKCLAYFYSPTHLAPHPQNTNRLFFCSTMSTVTVTVTSKEVVTVTQSFTETVTATITQSVEATAEAAHYVAVQAEKAIGDTISKSPHSLIRTICIIIVSTMVAAAVGILGMAGYSVFSSLRGFFQEKYESQDRVSISSSGIGIRVKNRTEQDRSISAQRLAHKIWPGPARKK